ncbi:bifunctional DNA primase/polymerase [Kitasatospora cineracea]|uniref:Bifunctional DNA primase/polymerase-like protein n=1 Tax=Kitasatospora cineracea TaxID=88074 RepID=A0A8G1UKR4_9ACTN|nr:bifunctional DNA primase/polymerase [Kitasatospora cineracea]ROR43404.1 bifunctional DNA primase/polymerase-like protein [Kitasatospora cineracea]
MTQPTLIRGEHLPVALSLAVSGVPVLPLRAGKVPFGNCPDCVGNACGGRPNMKTPGPCTCLAPCHGWAAATTEPGTLNSAEWARAWQQAAAVAYHPGGAGVTVVDLDNPDAIAWAREHLPGTRTVPTTRGEHWIYRGVMPSANAVRPGVDIKSAMSYARWLGPGTGTTAALPDAVRALVVREPAPARPTPVTVTASAGGGQCPHRTPTFLERGIAMAEQRIAAATAAVHATVFGAFLAVLSTHGRCGCLTEAHIARLFAAAGAKGESARHCADAWANAVHRLGM